MSDAAFWDMSMTECAALLERHKARIDHDEFMSAQIAAFVYNYGGCVVPQQPLETDQLMPSRSAENALSAQQMLEQQDPLVVIRRLDAFTERHPEMPTIVDLDKVN